MAELVQQPGLQRVAPAAENNPTEQARQMWETARLRWQAMPPARRNWLLVSALFLVAAAAGLVWMGQRTDWKTLFTGLESKDVQQVSQELAAAGIPAQLTEDGTGIQVPAELLDKARMEVAAKGMPQSGRLGFELFDKPNWVGSEFDEKVNYQRAMEGELEHTIETLAAVRSARVHLVLPEQSLFTQQEHPAKASVVLKLKRAAMAPDQVEAIRSLVAGAVDNLSPDQVTLVDADGRVDLKPRSRDAAAADVEQAMEAKLVQVLEPLAGRDNVRATVSVSYDQGAEEHMDEVYDPNQVAPVQMQKNEQTSGIPAKAEGVPGTASNSPTPAPVGSVAGSQAAAAPGTPPLLQKQALPVYPQGAAPEQSLRQENGTYAVSKHLTHSEEGPGRVRRVTAAVVINDRASLEGNGKLQQIVWKPRSADEMRRMEELAQAAVGFDAKRGDQVVLQNVSFSSNTPAMRAPVMDRAMEALHALSVAQPGLARSLAVGACGLLLVWFVLRPLSQQIMATLREPVAIPAAESYAALPAPQQPVMVQPLPTAAPALAVESNAPEPFAQPRMRSSNRGVFDYVAEQVRREPAQSTRLLEAWIASGEESK